MCNAFEFKRILGNLTASSSDGSDGFAPSAGHRRAFINGVVMTVEGIPTMDTL
jgi:hypothetical protein